MSDFRNLNIEDHEILRKAIQEAVLDSDKVKSILDSMKRKNKLTSLFDHNLVIKTENLVRLHLAREISHNSPLTHPAQPKKEESP